MVEPYYIRDGIALYCADSRDVVSELEDGSVDLVLTDPPYGHNNNNNGDLIFRREAALGKGRVTDEDARPIAGDGPDEASELAKWLFAESKRILKPGACCCCCCGGGGPDPQFARWSLWMDEQLDFKQMVVWDKGPIGMGWHYRRSYETVLVGQKPGAACKWYDETNKVENIIRHIRKIIPSADQHPTIKPLELMRHFIRLHTKPGDVVLDPFCGSGTTLRAAMDMGRRAVGIDVDERWCKDAVSQLQQLTLFNVQ